MKDLEKLAWAIAYANDHEPAKFWGELDMQSQEHYKAAAIEVICTIESRMLNGNWTDAIALFIDTPGMKLSYLDYNYYKKDIIILGDYIIEELRK